MPLWLRMATYNFIADEYEAQHKAQEEASSDSSTSRIDLSDPNNARVHLPSHYIGASKK